MYEVYFEEDSSSLSPSSFVLVDGEESSSVSVAVDESSSSLVLDDSSYPGYFDMVGSPVVIENWQDKPLNDYSVTEGLLLLLVLSYIAYGIFKLFKVVV